MYLVTYFVVHLVVHLEVYLVLLSGQFYCYPEPLCHSQGPPPTAPPALLHLLYCVLGGVLSTAKSYAQSLSVTKNRILQHQNVTISNFFNLQGTIPPTIFCVPCKAFVEGCIALQCICVFVYLCICVFVYLCICLFVRKGGITDAINYPAQQEWEKTCQLQTPGQRFGKIGKKFPVAAKTSKC